MVIGSRDTQANPFGGEAPAGAPAATSVAGAPARQQPRREGWLGFVFVVLCLGVTALVLVRAERAALHDPVQRGQRGEVVAAEGISLVRAPNLRRALALVATRTGPSEVVTSVELSPVAVRVLTRDERDGQRSFEVDLAYEVEAADGGQSASAGPRLATVDPTAPERLVNEVLRRGHFPAQAVERISWRYDQSTGQQAWQLRLRDVRVRDHDWLADGSGHGIHRVGDPTPTS